MSNVSARLPAGMTGHIHGNKHILDRSKDNAKKQCRITMRDLKAILKDHRAQKTVLQDGVLPDG